MERRRGLGQSQLPYLHGGSDGNNGQTGRKLVMDYYGPRMSIGGGALAGKRPGQIDRVTAYAAHNAAVHAVCIGARGSEVHQDHHTLSIASTAACHLSTDGLPSKACITT